MDFLAFSNVRKISALDSYIGSHQEISLSTFITNNRYTYAQRFLIRHRLYALFSVAKR